MGIEPTLLRTCALSMRLNHSAKTAFQKIVQKSLGGAGYRSLCLLHAKQTLYHLSYTPKSNNNNLKKFTMRGDRTRDQSIKSRTLYQTELARHKWSLEKKMTPEGIEPPIFGSGIRRVTIAPWSQLTEVHSRTNCLLFVFEHGRHCVRVVKELVLKANGLRPREFKSRRCRIFWQHFFFSLIIGQITKM